jgi:23S rRNA (adenine2503-C2)-methyltransferase
MGCTEKCQFCATSVIAFFRNLEWYEIINQVAQANRVVSSEGRSIHNIVFMGMGEPLQGINTLTHSRFR